MKKMALKSISNSISSRDFLLYIVRDYKDDAHFGEELESIFLPQIVSQSAWRHTQVSPERGLDISVRFGSTMGVLRKGGILPKKRPLPCLSPFVDSVGKLQVSGRWEEWPILRLIEKHPLTLAQEVDSLDWSFVRFTKLGFMVKAHAISHSASILDSKSKTIRQICCLLMFKMNSICCLTIETKNDQFSSCQGLLTKHLGMPEWTLSQSSLLWRIIMESNRRKAP